MYVRTRVFHKYYKQFTLRNKCFQYTLLTISCSVTSKLHIDKFTKAATKQLRVAIRVAIGGDDGAVRRFRRRWTLLQVSAAAKECVNFITTQQRQFNTVCDLMRVFVKFKG